MSIIESKVLIADPLNDKGANILKDGGINADTRPGLSEDQLCEIIGQYEGLIVRSARTAKLPKVIEAGRKLRVIGRAGVGVDNINLEAATKAGVIVENTPLGNITSAAEHALALLFSSVRNIPPRGSRNSRAGVWNRKLTGVELTGKTLGIIGMGKVGGIVAKVARALDMDIIVYDPYLTDKKAEATSVWKKGDLPRRCMRLQDFITIHTPKTPETIEPDQQGRVQTDEEIGAPDQRGARRDRQRSRSDRSAAERCMIAGAALDVFEKEPLDADSPLKKLDCTVLTPHLGASTEEAQERVAEDIAKQFVEFFRDGVIRNAVNLKVVLNPKLAAWDRLAEQLGAMAGEMAKEVVAKIEVGTFGRLGAEDTRELGYSARSKVCWTRGSDDAGDAGQRAQRSRRTARRPARAAQERLGPQLRQPADRLRQRHEDAAHAGRVPVSEGQETGRIVRIDDFEIDLNPAPVMLLMFYPDRPGMIGKLGTILGEADINIAHMAARSPRKTRMAVVALTLDDSIPDAVLKKISAAIHVG